MRVVAATDADLEARAAGGGFKAPLFHRLAGYVLRLPPLRERRDDIARLLVHFLRLELAAAGEPAHLGRPIRSRPPWLRAAAVAALVRHDWPGNVRELRNAARRLVIASRGAPRAHAERLLAELASPRRRAGAAGAAARAARAADHRPSACSRRCASTGGRPAPPPPRSASPRRHCTRSCSGMPGVRKARDLGRAEILGASEPAGGDVDAMAAALQVSRRGLVLRMRELEMDLVRARRWATSGPGRSGPAQPRAERASRTDRGDRRRGPRARAGRDRRPPVPVGSVLDARYRLLERSAGAAWARSTARAT